MAGDEAELALFPGWSAFFSNPAYVQPVSPGRVHMGTVAMAFAGFFSGLFTSIKLPSGSGCGREHSACSGHRVPAASVIFPAPVAIPKTAENCDGGPGVRGNSARALRIVRFADGPDHSLAGRMVISGRMADVCAELERMTDARNANR